MRSRTAQRTSRTPRARPGLPAVALTLPKDVHPVEENRRISAPRMVRGPRFPVKARPFPAPPLRRRITRARALGRDTMEARF